MLKTDPPKQTMIDQCKKRDKIKHTDKNRYTEDDK